MELNKIQKAIISRQESKKDVVNLSFADFTFYESLLEEKKIQSAFINIFKYPYYYPTAKGEFEARKAISNYYHQFRQEVDPEKILITSGLNQAFLYLLKIFSADGGEILSPTPNSPALEEVASILNVNLKSYQLSPDNAWQTDLKSLKKALTSKTRAIFLMSPHLPTGAIQTTETLSAIFELIKDKNIVVIADESLSDFIFNQKEYPIIQSLVEPNQPIISLQTLSNGFALPGLKLAWLTFHGHQDLIEPLMQSVEYLADTFLTLNQISQNILLEVVKYSDKWRYNFQKQVEKNRDILVSKLSKSKKLSFHYPEGGFYCLVQVNETTLTDEDLVEDLILKTGVYVHPGYYYGLSKGCYFMISFLQDPSTLRHSLKKIINYFK